MPDRPTAPLPEKVEKALEECLDGDWGLVQLPAEFPRRFGNLKRAIREALDEAYQRGGLDVESAIKASARRGGTR